VGFFDLRCDGLEWAAMASFRVTRDSVTRHEAQMRASRSGSYAHEQHQLEPLIRSASPAAATQTAPMPHAAVNDVSAANSDAEVDPEDPIGFEDRAPPTGDTTRLPLTRRWLTIDKLAYCGGSDCLSSYSGSLTTVRTAFTRTRQAHQD
jgi:hypothetical protein